MTEKTMDKTIQNDDRLIVVDRDDNIIKHESKALCHEGDGITHRAFSIFIFNSKKEILMQQRSKYKLLWPLYWSNSVCSHPREGENYDEAVHRRLKEEIAIDTEVKYLFKFQYQARFRDTGSENELCSVYIGMSDDEITANPEEIADWTYFGIDELTREVASNPERFTPWFKIEWQRIVDEHRADIDGLRTGVSQLKQV